MRVAVIAAIPASAAMGAPAPEEAVATRTDAYGWTMLVAACAAVVFFVARRLYRLPDRPEHGRASSLLLGAAAMVLLAMAGAWIAWLLAGPKPAPDAGAAALLRWQAVGAVGALAGQVPVCVLWARGLVQPRPRGRDVLLGALVAVVSWPIIASVGLLAAFLAGVFGLGEPDPIAHETLALLAKHPTDPWAIALTALAVGAAPFTEEILYRGMIQPALRDGGVRPWTAVAVTSIVFTAMHLPVVEPVALGPLFVLSLALGWARERTGGVTAGITAHAMFNAANTALLVWQYGALLGG